MAREVAHHAVHAHRLVDVARYYAVVVALFGEIGVVVVRALVRKEQRAVDVRLDGLLLRRQPEEQLVETPYVFARLCGTVLREVLRQCEHERLASVEHVYFLALLLGEAERAPEGEARNQCAAAYEGHKHGPDAAEAALDVCK